jgi:dimethylaniline monooxygenase (N-oxide forming)
MFLAGWDDHTRRTTEDDMHPSGDRDATVCIIGAGSSGIAAAQVLHARGIDFDCFEIGSEVGGNWRYENDNGQSSAYR